MTNHIYINYYNKLLKKETLERDFIPIKVIATIQILYSTVFTWIAEYRPHVDTKHKLTLFYLSK